MSPILFPILWATGLLVFAGIIASRFRLLLAARPAARLDRIPERIRRMVVDGLGQKKFLAGEQPAGIMHALIFWGFLVLMIQVIILFGRAFDASWQIPGFGSDQPLGPPFFLARDLLEATVIVGVGYMLYRRLVVHTPRLFGMRRAEQRYRDTPHWESILILVFILLIMVGGLLYDAGHLVAYNIHGNERDYAPLTALLATALGGLTRSSARTVSEIGWWVHCLTILVFLSLLPLSKHFHIITALPNVFFGKLPASGVDRPLAITQVPAAAVASLDGPPEGLVGVSSPADLSWKQVLDAFSCTECGRCTAVCPATASGAPLAPRQLILDIRDRLYHDRGEARRPDPDARHDAAPLIADDVLWSCTTCMACVEACPVGIEHVPTIIDLRRNLVDQGELDPLLQQDARELRQAGQLLRRSRRACARVGPEALEFEIPDARKEPVEYLWFVGDFASFDARMQLASKCFARVLHDAGVSSGCSTRASATPVTMCAGSARRDCSRCSSSTTWAPRRGTVRGDLHDRSTLVQHVAQRVPAVRPRQARLPLHRAVRRPVRHGQDLAADSAHGYARHLSRSVLSGALQPDHRGATQADRSDGSASSSRCRVHGTNTFCCGAGGGRIWMEDPEVEERPSEQRIREAQTLGELDYFLVSCPKDLAMSQMRSRPSVPSSRSRS